MVVRYGRWAVGACDDVCYGGMPYYTTNNHTTNNDTRQHQPAHTRTPTTRCQRGRVLQQGRRKGKSCQQPVRHATWYAIPRHTRAILTPGLWHVYVVGKETKFTPPKSKINKKAWKYANYNRSKNAEAVKALWWVVVVPRVAMVRQGAG